MFHNFTETQPLADILKGYFYEHSKGATQRKAIKAIQHLERLPWNTAAFEDTLKTLAPASLEIDQAGKVHFTPGGQHTKPIEAICYVIYKYDELMNGHPALFDTDEAAAYLGVTTRTIKKYLYEVENPQLKGTLKGKTLIFTLQDLYSFEQTRNDPDYRPGRPKAEPSAV